MADEGSTYNHSNRAFLQAFLARSSLTFDEARPILAAIYTAHGQFSSIIHERGEGRLLISEMAE